MGSAACSDDESWPGQVFHCGVGTCKCLDPRGTTGDRVDADDFYREMLFERVEKSGALVFMPAFSIADLPHILQFLHRIPNYVGWALGFSETKRARTILLGLLALVLAKGREKGVSVRRSRSFRGLKNMHLEFTFYWLA